MNRLIFCCCIIGLALLQSAISKRRVLSHNQPTRQSSTQGRGKSSLAVDNNKVSCSITKESKNPWWQVYLPAYSHVIGVTFRLTPNNCCPDLLKGYQVLISNNENGPFRVCNSASVTTPTRVTKASCNKSGRIIRIRLIGTRKILKICDIFVYGTSSLDSILSKGRSTRQSSISTFFGRPAAAIDGNKNKNYKAYTCMETTKERNPWWQVHLKFRTKIDSVTIYNNKGDCCDFKVLVANNPNGPFKNCASRPRRTPDRDVIRIYCSAVTSVVRIQLPGSTKRVLSMCEVEVRGKRRPDRVLSQGRPTEQSSTTNNAKSSFAVDGNIDQHYFSYSCSHTHKKAGKNPWWQVHLKRRSNIRTVTIYNRGDCCGEELSGFEILVANNPNGPFKKCAKGPRKTVTGQIIRRRCKAAAKVVRIQLPGTNRVLCLCEVEVR